MGYIYLLKNPHISFVKVGFTTKTPEERALDISSAIGVINMQEHLNQEVRRREHVIPIFPNHRDVVFRLIGEYSR